MSGFSGNYYYRVLNVNRSRILTKTLENIQGEGFNMYNTSTITQVPTNTQTTTTQTPTITQTTTTSTPVNTQTTTTSQVSASSTTLPNIGQTVITPVGTITGATQERSSTENPRNSTGEFNFFNNLYLNTGGFGYYGSQPQNQGFGFNNTQNPPPGFGGGFGEGNPEGPPGGGNPGGSPEGGGNPGGLDPNVAALVNVLTGMNIRGGYAPREGSFVKSAEFGETETEDPNEWLERFN